MAGMRIHFSFIPFVCVTQGFDFCLYGSVFKRSLKKDIAISVAFLRDGSSGKALYVLQWFSHQDSPYKFSQTKDLTKSLVFLHIWRILQSAICHAVVVVSTICQKMLSKEIFNNICRVSEYMAHLARRCLLFSGFSINNLHKVFEGKFKEVIEARCKSFISADSNPYFFLAFYCSGNQTKQQGESNHQHQHQDAYFLNNSRKAATPHVWRWKDEQTTSPINEIIIKKDNIDSAEANRANGCVKEVVRVLNALQKTDDMPAKLAEFSGKLSSHDFVIALKVMRDTRLAFSFFNWYKQQPNYTPELNTFMAVIRCLLHDSKWQKLSIVIDEMYARNLYLNSHMFCAIMREASAKGQINISEKWFSRMKEFGIPLDLSVYNTLMLVYNKAGKVSEVFTLFKEMSNNKVLPSILSYCHLLSACKSSRNVEKAEVVFQQMKHQGIMPDVVAYTLLLEIYGREGNIEKLKAILDEMKTLGIVPDVRTYTCLINAYGKAKMFDLVSYLFEDCHKTKSILDETFYSSTIRVYCQANMYKQAEGVVKFMQEKNIPVTELCYSTIIAEYAKAGRWKSAIRIFKSMKSSSGKAGEVLSILMLSIFRNARQVASCEELFRNMLLRRQNRNAAAYEIMIKVYEETNRPAQISDLFNRMKYNNCVGNINIYNKFIAIFGGSMNTSMASKVFEEMKLRKIMPTSDTYFLLLGAYLKAGEYENAISLHTHIKKNKFMLEAKAIEIMIEVLTKAGKLEEAEKLSKEKN